MLILMDIICREHKRQILCERVSRRNVDLIHNRRFLDWFEGRVSFRLYELHVLYMQILNKEGTCFVYM